jgi:serine/threonine protein kinase
MRLSDDLIHLLKRMLCRDPAERITIDEIKRHPWFPSEQYALLVEASKSMMQFEDDNSVDELDDEILSELNSNGLDCTGLPEALAAGEGNEMTVLYNVILRQKQAERMNCILRMPILTQSSSQDRNSLPARTPGLPMACPASPAAQTTDRPKQIANVPPVDWSGHAAIAITPRSRRTPVMAVRPGLMEKAMRPLGETVTLVEARK